MHSARARGRMTQPFDEGVEDQLKGSDGKHVAAHIFMLLFERMYLLCGFANMLIDVQAGDDRIEMLADRIVDFDVAVVQNVAKRLGGAVHGLYFTDDWGSQQATFISPGLWDEFFKPRYQRVIDAIHEQGWHAWMRSDGRVNAIVDSLIKLGLDGINFRQPLVAGIEEVGERFSGRICFESMCDRQQTLPFKGVDELRQEAQLLLEHWATPDGGFVLAPTAGAGSGVTPQAQQNMVEAFLEADSWRGQ